MIDAMKKVILFFLDVFFFLPLMAETDHAIQIQKLTLFPYLESYMDHRNSKWQRLSVILIKSKQHELPHHTVSWSSSLITETGACAFASSFKFHPYWTISTRARTHTNDINAFRGAKWCRNHRKILFQMLVLSNFNHHHSVAFHSTIYMIQLFTDVTS